LWILGISKNESIENEIESYLTPHFFFILIANIHVHTHQK